MQFNYAKTFAILIVCGAAVMLVAELIMGWDPGRSGGSLGKLAIGLIFGVPLMALADLVSWLRERARVRRAHRARLAQ